MRFKREIVIRANRYHYVEAPPFDVELREDDKCVGGTHCSTVDEAMKVATDEHSHEFLKGK